jgi:hypothetical protein
MSIAFGIYDFFSYTVPGVLYILVANQLLLLFKLPGIDINNLNTNIGSALLWVVVAYVVGQLMDSFAIRLYYLINKFHAETKAMKEFREKHKGLIIDFTINERQTLFSVIRHNNLDLALFIDNFKAISIMLNNISLALFLFSIEQVVAIFFNGFSLAALATIAVSAIFGYVAITRSALFNEWHWAAVYRHARQYGKSVPEMFKVPVRNKPKTDVKDTKK